MLIHFYWRFFLLIERGQWVYELFYKFERFDASVLQVPDILCSFPIIKPPVQQLEVPSYPVKWFTLPEDVFECSSVLQAFVQLVTRLNSMFINFCVYPWKLPVYRVPGGVEYVFCMLKLELKWITHSMWNTQLKVPKNSAVEYWCKLCCQTSGSFLIYTVSKSVYSLKQLVLF